MKLLPYLLLEIVMPGGTLLAVALYLYRNRKNIFREPVESASGHSTSDRKQIFFRTNSLT
jgi:hypothetical protein